ncbi:hypothetical protein J421_2306 [Gemmatirosa kalamazoonensis]|uniref:Uncharacterized protein n=1 Tax=Gemmatirosa kalamazoonensis TaxID=861299 RepID=W0RK86_9BACT|nr:hypothetical protein [Gemmatirosa kalamazoonensis]AHG89843.1 hypothetical protein J421_2306 [Gemmatirosa kalamazoonensis]
MPTLAESIATFLAKADAGEIVNRKTGRAGRFPKSRRDPILSNVRAAVRHALIPMHGDRCLSDAELEATEMAPLFASLPDVAYLGAVERSDPGKERSNVRLFVSVVTGRDAVTERKPADPSRVLPPFEPLYEALVRDAEATGLRRNYPAALLRFQDLLLANGVADPTVIPDDFDAVMAMGARVGRSRSRVHYELGAYRKAADLLGAADLPRCYEVVTPRGQGIRGLPDHPELLRRAGVATNPLDLTPLDMVKALAPKLGAAVEEVTNAGRHAGLSPAWERSLADTASWIVASLIRLQESHGQAREIALPTLTWYALWTHRVAVQITGTTTERDDQLAELLGESAAPVEMQPLMRRLADISARRSYEHSPLTLKNPAHEDDEVPVYTEKLMQQVEIAFMIAHRFFGTTLLQKSPEKWVPARVAYEELTGHMETYNKPRHLVGRKAKGKLVLTWPQLVCLGLPYLRRRALHLEAQVQERRARLGHLESRESQKLVDDFHNAVRDYVTTAVLADDSLRVKNYSGAIAGEHVVVTPIRDARGRWVGVSEIRTRFSGLDEHEVSLKVDTRGTTPNERERRLSPGIVDHRLFHVFWTEGRARALVRAGVLPDVQAFDPADDGYAVWVTPRPSERQRTAAGWRGHMSTDSLSEIFGRSLHAIVRDVLRMNVPDYDDPALTEEYRAIFSAHYVRLLVGNYFGGVLGDWTTACVRTNDSEATLRKHYVHISAAMNERMHRRGPENPRWFNSVIARMLELRDGDDWDAFWDAFDPDRPDAALPQLETGPTAAERRRRRRAA